MASAATESPAAVPEPMFAGSNATVSNPSSEDEALSTEARPKKRARHLCSLGTGEVIHMMFYKSKPGNIDEFEARVQCAARCFYKMEASVTDVRVCHPCCGEVVFIITFVSQDGLDKFKAGPKRCFESKLAGMLTMDPNNTGAPCFSKEGSLMPACHTLDSLLEYLKLNVHGTDHREHDVRAVSKEMEKWFPRESEYKKHITLCPDNPTKYTRNLIFGNEHFDCILMCWPAGAVSSIHDHEESSCWVVAVEGSVHEVQFGMPMLDKKFLQAEKTDPANAVGTCGKLKVVNVAELDTGGVTGTYANNEIGVHRVENRTDKLACTLHVYAPPLKKMRIFDEATGKVHVHLAAAAQNDEAECCHNPAFDVDAWNSVHQTSA